MKNHQELKEPFKKTLLKIGFIPKSEDEFSLTLEDENHRKVSLEIEPPASEIFGIWVHIDEKKEGYLLSQLMQCWPGNANEHPHLSFQEQLNFLESNIEEIYSQNADLIAKYNNFDNFNINKNKEI